MKWLTLPVSFFERSVDLVATELIGCLLVSPSPSEAVGRIVETEAYGMDEEAFFGRHVRPTASGELTTSKTGEVLRGARGVAFVYSVYFGNWLLNIVAGPPGYLGCVLLRAVEPVEGVDVMRRRRNTSDPAAKLAAGPGRLTRAFAVDGSLNGHKMQEPPLLLCQGQGDPPEIVAGPRVGLKRGRKRPWRFVDRMSRSLSYPVPAIIADRYGSP